MFENTVLEKTVINHQCSNKTLTASNASNTNMQVFWNPKEHPHHSLRANLPVCSREQTMQQEACNHQSKVCPGSNGFQRPQISVPPFKD